MILCFLTHVTKFIWLVSFCSTDDYWFICFKNSDNLLYSAAYGLVEVPEDFASYLLGIVLVNLLIYFFCYIIMKVLYMLQLPGLHLI